MMRTLQGLVPRRLTTQITIIVAISVLLGVLLTALLAVFFLRPPPPHDSPVAIAQRIAGVTELVQTAKSPEDISRILSVAGNARARIERVPIADLLPQDGEGERAAAVRRALQSVPGLQVIERRGQAGDRREQVAVKLDETQALVFDVGMPPRAPWGLLVAPATLVLTILFIFVFLLSVYAVRWIIAPLTAVAEAAQSFGRSLQNDRPIRSDGPREIAQVASAMNEMRTRIRSLLDDRTRMLAAISHDLRTPLTRLRLRAERVEPQALQQGMLADLTKISHMLDETLEYLRGDAAREALSRVDLPSLLQTIASEFADVGHAVSYEGPSRLDGRVRPRALMRAITNIVENGVKHAQTVKIMLERGAGNIAEITIVDDGPGIPPGLSDKVFEPFFKADNARAGGGLGFGLGLSIAQDVIRQHDGTIELISDQPAGLKVRIRLPS